LILPFLNHPQQVFGVDWIFPDFVVVQVSFLLKEEEAYFGILVLHYLPLLIQDLL